MTTATFDDFSDEDIQRVVARAIRVEDDKVKQRWHRAYGLRTYMPGSWKTPLHES